MEAGPITQQDVAAAADQLAAILKADEEEAAE